MNTTGNLALRKSRLASDAGTQSVADQFDWNLSKIDAAITELQQSSGVVAARQIGPEVPMGTVNGINKDFLLANAPNPESSVWGFWNNAAVFQPEDFSVIGAIVTMTIAPNAGESPDVLRFFYRY